MGILNKRLIYYALIYNALTVVLIVRGWTTPNLSAMDYFFYVPAYWVIAGIVLWWLCRSKIITVRTSGDTILILLSTPLPVLVLAIALVESLG